MSPTTAPERAKSPRNVLLARLHCLKKERGWSDDMYRDILQAMTGKRSAAELDFSQLYKVVGVLVGRRSGRRAKAVVDSARPADEWAFIDRAVDEKRPLLRKIFALCRAMGKGRSYAEGVARRQSGNVARRLEMMRLDELYKVAQALATTQRAAQAKEPTGSGAVFPTEETTP